MGNAISEMCCQDKTKPQANSSLNHGGHTNGTRVNPDSVSLLPKDQQMGKKPATELRSIDREITPGGDPIPSITGPGGAQREPLNALRPSALDTGDKKKVSLDDFVLKKVVGRGSFGKVHLALHKPTNQLVALKKLKKKEIEERMQVENVLNEKKILQTSVHPFIVRLLFAFQNEGNIYLGMEYMPGGELFYHLRQHRRFNAQGALFYASEVLLALEYLHDQGIIYRDLKPENILLDKDGHIKVTDFGLSKIDKITNSFCGTPEYFAPEIILGSGYGREVDWWSFGCFLYEIMVGKPPFQDANRSKLYKMIIEGKVNYPDQVSIQARDLISKLLNPVAEERLGAKSAKDVKQHPFFASVNWNQVFNKEIKPPFKPPLKNLEDTGNFDVTYTREPVKETFVDPSNLKYDDFTYQESAMAKNM